MKSPETDRSDVGERIRAARVRRGLSQEELGQRLGLTKGQVSRYENNLSPLTVDRLREIAGALRVTLSSLLTA